MIELALYYLRSDKTKILSNFIEKNIQNIPDKSFETIYNTSI